MDIIRYLERLSNLKYSDLMLKVWGDEEVELSVIDLNTRKQLFDKGVNKFGETIGNYSETSVVVYGKPNGHIRLYDTGEFYKSFELLPKGVDAEVIAQLEWDRDGEFYDLGRYGEIVGLTNESKDVLKKVIQKVLEYYTKQLLQVNR